MTGTLSMRRGLLRVRPSAVIAVAVCLLVFYVAFLTPSHPPLPSSHVDVRAVLTVLGSVGPFSSPRRDPFDTTDVSFAVLGEPLRPIRLDSRSIIDTVTGAPIKEPNGDSFNPALLKLPSGLKWQYVVVARGPRRVHKDTKIGDRFPVEQSLVAFAANQTSTGQLEVVSTPFVLPLPQSSAAVCGYWAFTYGAEDPRLYWSDSGTPVLNFVQTPSDPKLCRSIGLVTDLRSVWPELVWVLREAPGIPLFEPLSEEKASLEMLKESGQSTTEKNWAAFFPGARPNGSSTPSYHYTLQPPSILHPTSQSRSSIHYVLQTLQQGSPSFDCIARHHPGPSRGQFHQSTPLYRLTLCDRGCEPTIHNTVLVAIAHVKKARTKKGLEYGRFILTWNVTAPHEYISVGPEFRFAGTDDRDVVYALSLTFEQTTPAPPPSRSFFGRSSPIDPYGLNPSHGFIDDDALVSLGIKDASMGTVLVSVRELLRGSRLCDESYGNI